MAFYVRLTEGEAKTWNTPTNRPNVGNAKVTYLQVDGDELDYIRIHFNNVPITMGNICRWKGEMAQFIFDNL